MKSDIFISYRREGGDETARLIREALQKENMKVFLDVEDLGSYHFDERILKEIKEARDFVIILSPGCLDRCKDENDWLRQEIAHAILTNRNIVPILREGFSFPPKETLPPDIRELPRYNCVEYSHSFFNATIERLLTFLETKPKERTASGNDEGMSSPVIQMQKYEEAKETCKKCELEYVDAEQVFLSLKSNTYFVSGFFYWLLLLCLVIPEFIFSISVLTHGDFDTFYESQTTLIVIALTIAFSVPIAGHFLGIFFRGETPKKALIGCVLAAVSVLLLGSLATGFRSIGTDKHMDRLDAITMTLVFFGVYAAIFFTALLISYYHHNPQILLAKNQLKESKKRYELLKNEVKEIEMIVSTINEH